MTGTKYYTPEQPPRLVFVDTGISCRDDMWIVQYKKHPYTKGSHRLKSPSLPICKTEREAQDNLDKYAASHGFKKADR